MCKEFPQNTAQRDKEMENLKEETRRIILEGPIYAEHEIHKD